ncbi:MAG: hypothetical protein WD030_02600, partial [Pirellulales bacterium]
MPAKRRRQRSRGERIGKVVGSTAAALIVGFIVVVSEALAAMAVASVRPLTTAVRAITRRRLASGAVEKQGSALPALTANNELRPARLIDVFGQ